jgi:hypothetical protein
MKECRNLRRTTALADGRRARLDERRSKPAGIHAGEVQDLRAGPGLAFFQRLLVLL